MKAAIYNVLGSFDWSSLFGDALAALMGAMVGAYFAFKLERVARKNEAVDGNVTEGNLALFNLCQMWNVLRQYQKDAIHDWRERPDAWLNMPVSLPDPGESLEFDTAKLAFLFHSSDANILNEVALQGRRFRYATALVARRNELLLAQVYPALSGAGIQLHASIEVSRIEEILGANLINQLKVLTNGIIENIDQDVKEMKDVYYRFGKTLVAQYPGKKFIKFSFDSETVSEPPPASSVG